MFLNPRRCSFERSWLHLKAVFRRLAGSKSRKSNAEIRSNPPKTRFGDFRNTLLWGCPHLRQSYYSTLLTSCQNKKRLFWRTGGNFPQSGRGSAARNGRGRENARHGKPRVGFWRGAMLNRDKPISFGFFRSGGGIPSCVQSVEMIY